MAGKSSIHRLPEEIKAYIEAQLATGCHTLDSLIEDLRERFPAEANAGSLPSRSAIGRYGQKLERRLAAIRASTEAARLIRAHAGDRHDSVDRLHHVGKDRAFSPVLHLPRNAMRRR